MKKRDDKQVQDEKNEAQTVVADAVVLGQNELDEWKQKYLRVLADYQNLEKRSREQLEEGRKYAAELVVIRFLSVLDTFERAQMHLQDTGLGYALKEFYAAFAEKGVQKLEVLGKPFDPHEMECIEVGEGQDGIVIAEIDAGYTLNGKIIRVAKVKVGKEQH